MLLRLHLQGLNVPETWEEVVSSKNSSVISKNEEKTIKAPVKKRKFVEIGEGDEIELEGLKERKLYLQVQCLEEKLLYMRSKRELNELKVKKMKREMNNPSLALLNVSSPVIPRTSMNVSNDFSTFINT
jgi:hypothetical protein